VSEHRPDLPLGDEVLNAVNDAMVALHKRHHGRKPVTARTTLLGDDLLACLLGDIYTDVEKTRIELNATRWCTRRAARSSRRWSIASSPRWSAFTNRRVARFISTHHVGPDLELELFVLES
jgi:hypothetical protein